MTAVTDFTVISIDTSERRLAEFSGQVLLIVNVASECGFTPQYAGLQALHERYADRGFSVLGFPCNQFGGQEPGDNATIRAFCTDRFGVTFPVFARIEVNGPNADPLYAWLKASKPGALGTEAIKWNFTKFLLGRDGQVLERFAPTTSPQALEAPIERALAVVRPGVSGAD